MSAHAWRRSARIRFLFANDEAGRARLLAYLNGVITAIRAELPKAFATVKSANLVIKRVPPAIEAGAPDGYEQDGPIDGSRPASYYINLRDTADWPKFSLPTLCFHEGLPGHVWQGNFVHALPTIRSQLAFNAYIEGWALYAEQLGDELGMYADDPFGRLGYLQSIQFRACRLVVDTGLHAKRWTRDQAIQWMVENNGIPVDAARGEIDRYCAWPGPSLRLSSGSPAHERSSHQGEDCAEQPVRSSIVQRCPAHIGASPTRGARSHHRSLHSGPCLNRVAGLTLSVIAQVWRPPKRRLVQANLQLCKVWSL